MEFSAADYQYMSRAMQLARRGLYTAHPNPRVGCVLVKEQRIVGEGWHVSTGGPHAEINALAQAGAEAQGADAYVTLEPCCHHGRTPPCTEALISAGVKRVVAAMQDPHVKVAGQGLAQLANAGISVTSGLLESQARDLNPGFIKRMQDGRPLVRCKMAMSLDGRTAMASGESQWITAAPAREDVQYLRARSGAILTGIGTVLADDPAMTVRLEGFEQQPLRVVIDTHLSMPPGAKMLGMPGQTLIMTCSEDEVLKQALTEAGAEIISFNDIGHGVDAGAVLDVLREREINEVQVEAGATLSGALLKAGLIDELVIYMAPVLMGDKARGLFRLPFESMDERIRLLITEQRQVGQDLRISATLVKGE